MANVDITKIIQAGEDRVRTYSKEVDEATAQKIEAGESVTFTDEDLVTYLTNFTGIGASKEVVEKNLAHLKTAVKMVKGAKLNDVSVEEALTIDAMKIRRKHFDENKWLVFASFDESLNQVYGCMGQISQWGAEMWGSEFGTLNYTLALSRDDIVATAPVVEDETNE